MRNTFVLPALLGTLLLLQGSCSAMEPYLTLYSERNSQGSSFTLFRGSHYIQEFDDKAKSICGVGVWFLYEDPDYAEKSTFVQEFIAGVHTCQDLDSSTSALVSSARYAGTQDIYEDSLTMYYHSDHKGPEYLVMRDIDFVRDVFEDVASSFVITGSSAWTVHEHPGMSGKSACMKPTQQGNWYYGIFDVADLHNFDNDMVSSVSKGCNSKNIVRYVPKHP